LGDVTPPAKNVMSLSPHMGALRRISHAGLIGP
jgi:hypothetical protein